MARRRTKGLTDREAEILARLWEIGEAVGRRDPPGSDRGADGKYGAQAAEHHGRKATGGGGRQEVCPPLPRRKDPQDLQAPALQRLLDTLFSGSAEGLVEALLEVGRLTPADLRRLARRYGRRG